jgi:hypothetical protein
MATLAQLKVAIAAFLQKTTSDFTFSSVDLLLVGINQSKTWAQQQHDFEALRTTATVSVNLSTGVLLSTAIDDAAASVAIKKIEAAYLSYTDGLRPIDYIGAASQASDLRRRYSGLPFEPGNNSPLVSSLGDFVPTLVQRGGKLYLYPDSRALFSPATTVTVSLDIIKFLADFGGSEPTDPADFFLARGWEFLMWKTICDYNYMWQEFVPREEGQMPPPTAQRDAAWAALTAWDNALVNGGTTAYDLD